MLDPVNLRRRIENAEEAQAELAKQLTGHALLDEYRQRLADARDALERAHESGSNSGEPKRFGQAVPALMFCCYNLNRCAAISELLADHRGHSPGGSNNTSPDVLRLGADRILLRWFISKLSYLRSRVLRYRFRYQTPPLGETLRVSLIGKAAAMPRLARLFKKLPGLR